ncbi:dsDNA nuclease domain-containing protein [Priestia aryabhattai]|uniref:dsDNA nuclease domain-containing protein n=1 Tax=Priestia TaxID=2800373 RepID=UPI003F8B50D5
MDNDTILSCLGSEYPRNQEKTEFLQENITSKKDSEIMEYLMSLKPEEVGGLTAISGFYYQFLVTIEYFIELLDGKWDFVAFELHDDIVVGNESEKKIRFIQVKTSNKNSKTPSGVSDLYLGSLKTVKETKKAKEKKTEQVEEQEAKKSVRVKDSWVDKLISKAQFFKTEDGYETQFQLYTSYHVVKTDNYNFDNYTDNQDYNRKVKKNDSLLKVLEKNTHDSKFNSVKYEELCGEPLEDLLSRFYIKTGSYMADVHKFINDIRVELSKRVFKDYKNGENIILEVSDIYLLIGMLCSQCRVNAEVNYLKVTKEDLEDVLFKFRERCLQNVEELSEEHGNISVLNRIIDTYLEDIEEFNLYKNIEDQVYTYKEYLLGWIDKKGSIRELFNRYVDGTLRTQIYHKTHQHNRDKTLNKLITLIVLLNILYNEILEFGESNYFLTKKSKSSGGNELLSLFNFGKSYNLEKSIEKIDLIMESADEREHLFLLDKELKIVLQNYTDRSFKKAVKRRLKTKVNIGEIEGLENQSSDINKVSLSSIIVPGKALENEWHDYLTLDDFQQFIDELTTLWNEVGGQ